MDNYFLDMSMEEEQQRKTARQCPRFAKVTAISGAKVRIQIDGESAPRRKLYLRAASYTPAVGDKVNIEKIGTNVGGTYFVTGKVAK